MPKHHEMDDIPENYRYFFMFFETVISKKINLTSPKCPKARTWLIVSMMSDKIKLGDDKSIIGKPRNKPKNIKIIISIGEEHFRRKINLSKIKTHNRMVSS